jgi:hypothetical protein
MQLGGLMSKIFGFLVIIITLALAPSINTANAAISAANITNCIGVSAIDDFAAPLIVLGLLAVGGIFAWKGTNNQGMKDILGVVSLVIVAIVGLTFMTNIITYTNTLIDASTGFATTIYGMIPLLVYITVIASVGVAGYKGWKGSGKKGKKAAAFANY